MCGTEEKINPMHLTQRPCSWREQFLRNIGLSRRKQMALLSSQLAVVHWPMRTNVNTHIYSTYFLFQTYKMFEHKELIFIRSIYMHVVLHETCFQFWEQVSLLHQAQWIVAVPWSELGWMCTTHCTCSAPVFLSNCYDRNCCNILPLLIFNLHFLCSICWILTRYMSWGFVRTVHVSSKIPEM